MSREEDKIEIAKKECKLCNEEAVGILRKVFLCARHYNVLERDNSYRHKNEIEITSSLDLYKTCFRDKCAKKKLVHPKEIDNPHFCSETCMQREFNTTNR